MDHFISMHYTVYECSLYLLLQVLAVPVADGDLEVEVEQDEQLQLQHLRVAREEQGVAAVVAASDHNANLQIRRSLKLLCF
jgi:hypothetical protein